MPPRIEINAIVILSYCISSFLIGWPHTTLFHTAYSIDINDYFYNTFITIY